MQRRSIKCVASSWSVRVTPASVPGMIETVCGLRAERLSTTASRSGRVRWRSRYDWRWTKPESLAWRRCPLDRPPRRRDRGVRVSPYTEPLLPRQNLDQKKKKKWLNLEFQRLIKFRQTFKVVANFQSSGKIFRWVDPLLLLRIFDSFLSP